MKLVGYRQDQDYSLPFRGRWHGGENEQNTSDNVSYVMHASSRWAGEPPTIDPLCLSHLTSSHKRISPFEPMHGRAPSNLDSPAERVHSEGTKLAAYHETLATRLANYSESVDAQLAACETDIQGR